jgi:hypothetical protein
VKSEKLANAIDRLPPFNIQPSKFKIEKRKVLTAVRSSGASQLSTFNFQLLQKNTYK